MGDDLEIFDDDLNVGLEGLADDFTGPHAGYNFEDVQWFLPPDMVEGTEQERAERLLSGFFDCKVQVRLAMVGENASTGGGGVIYGLKLAPHKDGQPVQKMLMVRIDKASGDFLDFRPVDRPALPSVRGNFSEYAWRTTMETFATKLFEPVATWHAEAFGPGPHSLERRAEWEAGQMEQTPAALPAPVASRRPRML